ncbi:MAG: hypothetical protein H6624_02740 [Bdellovibrionaceae bacterium]|nr:hypothetical protein [Bdellovibrionales bacterium]MCB9083229.1 hypothetical protein [Pseudobdellovibrionaceae bacterium]
MKMTLGLLVLLASLSAYAGSKKDEMASFNKVKTIYISHMQKKMMSMSQTTTCMAQAESFDALRECAKKGKAEIAALDKSAKDAHDKAQKVKK